MSGGYFDYRQWQIEQIADDIERLIDSNYDNRINAWGGTIGRNYPASVMRRFKQAVRTLRRAAVMAQRIDWLVSGDDGVEEFIRQWDEELKGIK